MKNLLIGAGALLTLTACNGFSLPVFVPPAPTSVDLDGATEVAEAEINKICLALDENYKNLQGWAALASILGMQFDFDLGGLVTIPAQLTDAKDRVCADA